MFERIDKWLVNNQMVDSRTKAQELIKTGSVSCNGQKILKPSFLVEENDIVDIVDAHLLKYVSRGGLKLEKALSVFDVNLADKTVLDIGSSTGGFSDCALQHGAKKVIAVDVGKNIFNPVLARDPRIELHEETDIRIFPLEQLQDIDFVTCDVSFISLEAIIPFVRKIPSDYRMILLIKPQFECGKSIAKKFKGVIHSPSVHKEVLDYTISNILSQGYSLEGLSFSPVRGGDGNIEYISYFSKKANGINPAFSYDNIIKNAFAELVSHSERI